jgi:pre-mycofactocin synthase
LVSIGHAPAEAQAIHPDGEVAVAKGAARAGTAIGQSSLASSDFKDVAAANPKAFFQLYWSGSRDVIQARVERMRSYGAKGLIITLDATMTQPRDWGSPVIPQTLDLKTMARYAPMGFANPRWLGRYLRRRKLPDLVVPNLQDGRDAAPTMVEGMIEWTKTPIPTWEDVRWLAGIWDGPFMVKGILTSEDARRAVDAGATAIGVSNHGGNNLDTTPATIRCLPAVAAAVGDDIEVVLDGGVRRGSDVVKAVALGARAVMIGRAYLWGLAANGQAGVENVLDILRGGIDSAVLGLGRSSIRDLEPSDVLVPDGFVRELGAPASH